MSPATGEPSEPSCVLEVRVTPKARRTDLRLVDDVIRVRVAEAPEDGNDKLLLEGNKRGKRLWLGPEAGIAILEPIAKRSINAFTEGLSSTIDNLRLQHWDMNWNDYFCPLWCEFCMNCEAELTGDIGYEEWI